MNRSYLVGLLTFGYLQMQMVAGASSPRPLDIAIAMVIGNAFLAVVIGLFHAAITKRPSP